MDHLQYEKFENFLRNEILPKGFEALTRAALVMLDDGDSVLSEPWILTYTKEAKKAAKAWVECPCQEHAKEVYEQAKLGEQRADAADEATTIVGDWWSYDTVLTVHGMCEYIAIKSGFPDPCPDDPCGLSSDDIDGLNDVMVGIGCYFFYSPYRSVQTVERAKKMIMKLV